MYLKKLSLINFKNIREENLEFRPGINCFVGDNGAGKTNVIDAVYFLSMCKSSLAMTDGQNMRHGSDFFLLDGQYLTDEGRSESVVCAFARKGGKTLKRNGKEYERLSDHVGLIPVVIVSPADTMLISDAADERRRYLNGFISQLDRAYLQALVRYNAVLGERNRLLKISRDEQMLCIYDRQLVEQGGIIHRKRSEIAALLEPEVARYYRHLSSDREQVTLEYRSELNDTPFEELLLKSREKDFVNGFTTAGIHRDDLVLHIGGYPLRKYGSQGQQKSFLIALKLAQYALVAQAKGEKPILLLDDLFDKLDAGRVEQLIRLVGDDDRSSSPTATRRVCAPFWTKQVTTTRSSRSKTEESCDETKQDGHRRRTARRIFPASLRRRQSRRRTAARHLARDRRSGSRRRNHRAAARKSHSARPHPLEHSAQRTFLPARSLGRRNQPPLENPTGQCGHHPVKFIFFLRGGSTILGRYWHYSKKKCIFAR